jgi:hypothetical protein
MPAEALATARVALFAGHVDQAYRLLLAAEPDRGQTPEFLDLAARVYLALDRPLRMAECYQEMAGSDPKATEKVRAILARQGDIPSRPLFSGSVTRWPGFDRDRLEDLVGVAPGPDGTVYLLRTEGLDRVGKDGRSQGVVPLDRAVDLSVDFDGQAVALGQSQVLWGGRVIALPAGMDRPASAAVSPEGSLLVLDRAARRLLRLDPNGTVGGVTTVAMRDPIKVRVDLAGRIYIADRDTGDVHVYGPDMVPLKVLSPEAVQHPVRRLEDMEVGLAGDVLLLDGRSHQLSLFAADGRFLGTSEGRLPRVDAFGWDGLDTLLFASQRAGTLGRVGT